jgi:hypothetical protein
MEWWQVALTVYGVGLVATFVLVLWSTRHEEESCNNEPGEDGAALAILLFIWPVVWCFFAADVRQKRREKRADQVQQSS